MKRVKRLSMACPACGPGVSVAAQARKALSAKTGSSKPSGNAGCSFTSRQKISSDSSEDPSKTSGRRPHATAYSWNLALDLDASPEGTLFRRVPMVRGASILLHDFDSRRMPRMTLSIQSKLLQSLFSSVLAAIVAVCTPLSAYAQTIATTTTLAITSNGAAVTSVVSGTVVTMTATVGVSPGQVQFCDAAAVNCTDSHLLATAQLTPAGTATYKFMPGIGSHSYKAVYVGTLSDIVGHDPIASPSSSQPQALTVTETTKTISATGTPGNYSLMATVPGGVVAPTGKISFMDTSNSNTLGTATLSAPGLSFLTSSTLNLQTQSFGVVVADFNGDGIPDIATSDTGNGRTVTVLLGNGDGTFAAQPVIYVDNNPNGLVVGDFNGDGIPDLAVDGDGANSVTVLMGNGDGTFYNSWATTVGSGPVGMAVINLEGSPSILVANYNDNTISFLLGNGDGSFINVGAENVGSSPQAIAVGDFYQDGSPGFAFTSPGANTVTLRNTVGVNKAHTINVGSGPTGIAVGDFNGDGLPDLAVANSGDSTVTVLLCTGAGTFTTKATPSVGHGPVGISVGDFNGDGIPDIATTNVVDGTVTVLLGNGDGTFTAKATSVVGSQPYGIAVGDFNRDGIPDITTANSYDGTVSVLLNQTSNTATATLTGVSVAGSGTHLADFIYAGDTNYGAGPSSNTVSLIGTQVATTLAVSSSLSTASYGQQVVLTAKLTPYYSGNLTTNAETVIFQSNGANIGRASLSSGVAVLNVTSLPVGTDNITAVYSGDDNFVTSISAATTVTVAPANQKPTLAWATPAAISYGTALSATQLNASVTLAGTPVAGSYVYSPATGTVPAAGTDTLTVTFTPTDTTAYSTQTASVPLIVSKATPAITWAAPSAITYGTALSTAQLNATSATPGSFAYTPAAGTVLTPGTQTLQVTLTPSDSTDYNSASATVSINVGAATPTLTFAPIANVTTNATPFSVNATSASPGAVIYGVTSGPATISGSTVTVTGAGTVVLSATQAAAGNYAAATATASFTVTTAAALDFTMSTGTATQSQVVNTGGAATYTLQIAPTGSAYPNNVTFTASGVPEGASFTFSPAIVPATNGPATVNFTVQTASGQSSNGYDNLGGLHNRLAPVALGLLLLPFAGMRRIRKGMRKAVFPLCALLLLAGMVSLTGCGGSLHAQAQSYNITVTATSGTLQHSTTVTLQMK